MKKVVVGLMIVSMFTGCMTPVVRPVAGPDGHVGAEMGVLMGKPEEKLSWSKTALAIIGSAAGGYALYEIGSRNNWWDDGTGGSQDGDGNVKSTTLSDSQDQQDVDIHDITVGDGSTVTISIRNYPNSPE